MGVPGQIKGITVKHQAHQLRTERGEQAADGAQQAKLDAPCLDQQLPFGTQGA
ncbi:hypothetical protein D3C71_2240490 [compost metagenome]